MKQSGYGTVQGGRNGFLYLYAYPSLSLYMDWRPHPLCVLLRHFQVIVESIEGSCLDRDSFTLLRDENGHWSQFGIQQGKGHCDQVDYVREYSDAFVFSKKDGESFGGNGPVVVLKGDVGSYAS